LRALAHKTVSDIETLQNALADFVFHPASVKVGITIGPYQVEQIWFDDMDGSPVLGVTYSEESVKNGKKRGPIFKSVTDCPIAVIAAWAHQVKDLVSELTKQKIEDQIGKFSGLMTSSIAKSMELATNDNPSRVGR